MVNVPPLLTKLARTLMMPPFAEPGTCRAIFQITSVTALSGNGEVGAVDRASVINDLFGGAGGCLHLSSIAVGPDLRCEFVPDGACVYASSSQTCTRVDVVSTGPSVRAM